MVVYYVCEVVRRHSVGLYQYLVFQLAVFDGYIPIYYVVISSAASCRHILTDNVFFPVSYAAFRFFLGNGKAMLVVSARAVNVGKRRQAFFGTKQ